MKTQLFAYSILLLLTTIGLSPTASGQLVGPPNYARKLEIRLHEVQEKQGTVWRRATEYQKGKTYRFNFWFINHFESYGPNIYNIQLRMSFPVGVLWANSTTNKAETHTTKTFLSQLQYKIRPGGESSLLHSPAFTIPSDASIVSGATVQNYYPVVVSGSFSTYDQFDIDNTGFHPEN